MHDRLLRIVGAGSLVFQLILAGCAAYPETQPAAQLSPKPTPGSAEWRKRATDNYQKILNSWMGHNVSELIETMGMPKSTLALPNGNTVYEFTHDQIRLIPVSQELEVPQLFSCSAMFTADKAGILISAVARGDGCLVE